MYGNFSTMLVERRRIETFLKLRVILHSVDKSPIRRKVSDAKDSYKQSELHPRKLHPFDVELFREMLVSIMGRVHFYFFTHDITITDIGTTNRGIDNEVIGSRIAGNQPTVLIVGTIFHA